MPEANLDSVYTSLAQAIAASGKQSELFLAMLSLRLIAHTGKWAVCEQAIAATLDDLQRHPAPPFQPQGD
ncbi:MAG TPA: hypothetical protein VEA35_16455 [Ramlibacter sp.]|nr:hypothetical protein [Ramlibacter sp.]